MKSKIIYVYDPLCGWCYGFSPVIRKIEEAYSATIDFDIISGGMVIGDREGLIADKADYILSVIPRLEEYTGVIMGEAYKSKLRDKSMYQSSMKPCIALEVFKSFNNNDAITFASEIQKAQYTDGDDLQSHEIYKKLIAPFGIDETEFIKRLDSAEYLKKTTDAFLLIQSWGITGFPAVIMEHKGQYFLIAKGYLPFDDLQKTIESILKKE
ncbi:MAG: DsbA family protein [Bacteroidetes bacterium]|nr:DsbA family protein [Bacteroidota bacterium]